MGDSLPPPAEFDLVGSFARRRGSDVEIVLAKPEVTVGPSATVTLRKDGSTVVAQARLDEGVSGPRLVVRAARTKFSNGTWSLTLQSGTGTGEPLAARLLVQGERPLVLLWGVAGTKSMVPPAHRADSARRRAAASAGRALDVALNVLPEQKAGQLRARARSTARRVLG